jgi:hypothetical protein
MHAHESPAQLIAGLRAGAAEISVLLAMAEEVDWQRRPAPGEWSLTEIACHLRDVEREVHLARLQRVAVEANAFIAAADTDPLAETRNYQFQDGPLALVDFLKARQELLRYVAGLPAEVWARTARHALFGTTTFAELVGLVIEHDQAHVEQMRALLDSVL